MAQTSTNSTTELSTFTEDSKAVSVEADKFESSPSLRAIANYIKKTSIWDYSLLKKEVA